MKLSNTRKVSPITYEVAPVISDETMNEIVNIESLIDRMMQADDISEKDLALYDDYRTRIQYEMRKGRFVLFRRIYDLINLMLDRLQDKIEMGEDLEITPSQMRLYMTMFLDQTRTEFEEKTPDKLIDARKQTINVIRIVGDESHLIDDHGNGQEGIIYDS